MNIFRSLFAKKAIHDGFDKHHRVKHNTKGFKPHFIDPLQDTNSLEVTFSVVNLQGGILTIGVETAKLSDRIQFTIPTGFKIEGNCLAAALACLCGDVYQGIHFAFPVSKIARHLISKECCALVTSDQDCPPREAGHGHCLAFSGGLDSLACRHIAPERDYHLMGIDFGGWFEREYIFLKNYDGIKSVCSTDFRRKKYDRNSWQFMAAPMMLVADHFGWRSVSFGTTLEASNSTLYGEETGPSDLLLFQAAGVRNETMLHGCSEFLGNRIVIEHEPEAVKASLVSLAALGSEKAFRKSLSIGLVDYLLNGKPINFSSIPLPKERVELGQQIAVDFASLVFAKYVDIEWLSESVNISSETVDTIQEINFNWLLKYHPVGLNKLEGDARTALENGLKVNKIEVFSDNDINDYNKLIGVLRALQE